MSRDKRSLQCPECGERIFESDEQCMSCGADVAQHRRQATAQEAADEEDWIGRAARAKIEDSRIETETKLEQPAAKARESADHFAWAAGGALVFGVLGLIGIVGETEDYALGLAFLLGGIGWAVIFLAGSRLLRCLAELTENVASMERSVRAAKAPVPEAPSDRGRQ